MWDLCFTSMLVFWKMLVEPTCWVSHAMHRERLDDIIRCKISFWEWNGAARKQTPCLFVQSAALFSCLPGPVWEMAAERMYIVKKVWSWMTIQRPHLSAFAFAKLFIRIIDLWTWTVAIQFSVFGVRAYACRCGASREVSRHATGLQADG